MTALAVEAVSADIEATHEAEQRRKQTLLRAVGLDRVSPEQRELALAIAKRYDLDLLLKHLVLIDGKPYVTRDALLWIAHRDGHLDGIEVTEPVIRDYQGVDYWYAEATVYRTDMGHPFKYGGRYPVRGGNSKFGPEMATKVAESMALRRAFNISAPTQDERWDVESPTATAGGMTAASSADHAHDGSSATTEPDVSAPATQQGEAAESAADLTAVAAEVFEGEYKPLGGPEVPEDGQPEPPAPKKAGMVQCESTSPFVEKGDTPVQCRREAGHTGTHRTSNESWSDPK